MDGECTVRNQVRFSLKRQWSLMDEWKKKNPKAVKAATSENWIAHLDIKLRKLAFVSAQREYRRQFNMGVPPIYVDITRDDLIKMREMYGEKGGGSGKAESS